MSFRVKLRVPGLQIRALASPVFKEGFRRPGCRAKGSIGCSSEYPSAFLAQVWKHTPWRLCFQGRCGEGRIKKAQMHYLCIYKRPDSGKKRRFLEKIEQVCKETKRPDNYRKGSTFIFVEWWQNCFRQEDTAVVLRDKPWDTRKVRWHRGHAISTTMDLALTDLCINYQLPEHPTGTIGTLRDFVHTSPFASNSLYLSLFFNHPSGPG